LTFARKESFQSDKKMQRFKHPNSLPTKEVAPSEDFRDRKKTRNQRHVMTWTKTKQTKTLTKPKHLFLPIMAI